MVQYTWGMVVVFRLDPTVWLPEKIYEFIAGKIEYAFSYQVLSQEGVGVKLSFVLS